MPFIFFSRHVGLATDSNAVLSCIEMVRADVLALFLVLEQKHSFGSQVLWICLCLVLDIFVFLETPLRFFSWDAVIWICFVMWARAMFT